jgi:hypothetical protein
MIKNILCIIILGVKKCLDLNKDMYKTLTFKSEI